MFKAAKMDNMAIWSAILANLVTQPAQPALVNRSANAHNVMKVTFWKIQLAKLVALLENS